MMHEIELKSERDFYDFWQGHKTAIIQDWSSVWHQWDTISLVCKTKKWKDLPIYLKLSFIELLKEGKVLLHLKK